MSETAITKRPRLIPAVQSWLAGTTGAWNQFWFTPRLPHTLAFLRIFAGLMLLYSHLVLASDLSSFLGDTAWINNDTVHRLHDGAFGFSDWGRSYLWYLSNPLLLWIHHGLTLAITACFAAGLLTRITAPAAWFLQLMYLHRLTGTLFGLDQIVTYCVMYLMLAPCGSLWSVDGWLRSKWMALHGDRRWFGWLFPSAQPSVAANIATRLLQIHLCTIYFFGGIAKARGIAWWDGTAMWYAAGNYEYQSVNLTWIADYPRLASTATHLTLLWEISYAALVWPKLTRPIVIGLAIAMHAGIALCMGMITFGTMMIAANFIFLPPTLLAGQSAKTKNEPGPLEAEPHEPELWAESEDASTDETDNAFEELDDFELEVPSDEPADLMGSSLSGLSGSSLSGSSLSGIGNLDGDLDVRQQQVIRRENRIREANTKINSRAEKLKAREAKYKDRVDRLKKREAKIKALVDRAKKKK